jgi:hypothetical protein
MNTLTSEMTRLCGEIASLRDSRTVLIDGIEASNRQLQKDVAELLGEFHKARVDMSEEMRIQLGSFTGKVKASVTQLRQNVQEFQAEIHKDMAGAHTAWYGAPVQKASSFRTQQTAAPVEEPKPQPAAEEPVRAEEPHEEPVSARKRGRKG